MVDAIRSFLDTYDVPHAEDTNFIDCPPVTPTLIESTCATVRQYYGRLVNDFTVAKELKEQLTTEQE